MGIVSRATGGGGAGGGVTAATVAGLGAGTDGKLGLLRAGASPYEFVQLIFDATLAKWVSTTILGPAEGTSTFTTVSTSYSNPTESQYPRMDVMNYLDLYNAGLRLQVNCAGFLSNSGANNTFAAVAFFGWTSADAGVAQIGTTNGGEIQNTAAAGKHLASGWQAFDPGAPTKQHLQIIYQVKVSAGTGTYSDLFYALRWVSA